MSESKDGESHGSGNSDVARDGAGSGADDAVDGKIFRAGDKNKKKQRSGDVGRALRTVYDDTLRENVPDDFMDLLGKLN